MGGEKIVAVPEKESLEGSPPRRRGKAARRGRRGRVIRDHPRVGGEKRNQCSGFSGLQGSPPRRRGKETVQAIFEGDKGITPAWAGKRRSQGAAALQSGDHPRVGGEKPELRGYDGKVVGSPPHGRGKAGRHGVAVSCIGITPAWAGKSRPRWRPE